MSGLGRVTIVMMSAIGDTVHVLPVVSALKRHAPAMRITWVLQAGPASLVRGHPAVDEIVVFEKKRGWLGLLDVRRSLRGQSADLLIDLQVYLKAGLVTWLAPATEKLGFDRARARDLNWLFTTRRIPPHEPQHVQDQYFEFLHALGIDPEPVEWQLGPWPAERGRLPALLAGAERPVAALVIGSSERQKEWLPDRWATLSDTLFERHGLQPALVGGRSPRELETERRIADRARHRPLSTLGASLRDLVAILDRSALVVSLDTGPLHMAVALERPVISLMGYNNPKRVGPYRRYHDLIVDAYGERGEDYPISLEHRLDRMARISVDDVLEKVARWENLYRTAPSPSPASTRS
ncbi:MAG: glycosyltransferase family 9 protein [Gemmatimonadaceae bacterium]